jgi:hypothetical protein
MQVKDISVERGGSPADTLAGFEAVEASVKHPPGPALQATDTDWSHGTGPAVSGPILALVLAMTGRKAAASQFSGEGVAMLQARP